MENPIEYPLLHKVVQKAIEERILSGHFAPGEKISEVDVAISFGVSRTPVKLALNELAAEGIVEMFPRRGAFVKVFSDEDIKKIHQVRSVLEGLSGRLAAQNRTDKDLKQLRTIVDTYRDLVVVDQENQTADSKKITAKLKRLDLDFHNTILSMSGNEHLVDIARRKNLQFQCFINVIRGESRESRLRVLSEHEQILKALEAGDADLCEHLMQNHIDKIVE